MTSDIYEPRKSGFGYGSLAPVDMARCRARTYGDHSSHRCPNKAKTEPDENGIRWCTRHSPEYLAKQEAERQARWDARSAQWRAASEEHTRKNEALRLMPDVLAYLRALSGINPHDPELDRLIAAITPL